MGKDAFSSHLPRPGQSCPQLWGSCGGVWKPPDIYSRYNRHAINTILHYMLGFFSFLFLFPPSTSLSLLFILFSLIRVLFSCHFLLFSLFYFLYLFYILSFFLIFSHHHKTNAIHILIQLIQCTWYIKPLKSMH